MIQARLKARWDMRFLKSKLNCPVRFAGRGFFVSKDPPWSCPHIGCVWSRGGTCEVGNPSKENANPIKENAFAILETEIETSHAVARRMRQDADFGEKETCVP